MAAPHCIPDNIGLYIPLNTKT